MPCSPLQWSANAPGAQADSLARRGATPWLGVAGSDPEAVHNQSGSENPEAEAAPITPDATHSVGVGATGGQGAKPAQSRIARHGDAQNPDIVQRDRCHSQGRPHLNQRACAGRIAGPEPPARRQRRALPMLLSRFSYPSAATPPEPQLLPHAHPAARLSKNWPWLAFQLRESRPGWGVLPSPGQRGPIHRLQP